MVSSADIFISTAQRFLCSGKKKKRLSSSSCLDVAIQMLAVDLGLKPALLYDSNAASAEQLLQYLNHLQENGLLATALQVVSIDGNSLVVNSELMKSHLAELLQKRSLITVDVCPWREQPTISDMESRTEEMAKAILEFFMGKVDTRSSVSVLPEEMYGQWNLCTLFGILLGYPASYWFDQSQGFENCLRMTPLVVSKVWVCWQAGERRHSSCLYSFSVPEILWSDVYTHIQRWTALLRDRFSKQAVLADFSFSKETVILPSVAL
ncbi:UPF0739 protein C1orf74 homolog [Salminus brasiliensis]|uniref:UPF0739 protein C1orf74 homolog n=1 Tax=Salminus brasiliensis TaxID=930266 RepID=UPI003B83880F